MFKDSVPVIIRKVQQVQKKSASEIAVMKRSTQQTEKNRFPYAELYGLETTGYRINKPGKLKLTNLPVICINEV